MNFSISKEKTALAAPTVSLEGNNVNCFKEFKRDFKSSKETSLVTLPPSEESPNSVIGSDIELKA
ncbi:TPA: hypothetical protein ACTXXA_001555, partial [Legionella anisa]